MEQIKEGELKRLALAKAFDGVLAQESSHTPGKFHLIGALLLKSMELNQEATI
ncbi:hypothetical protein [Vibrio jasicida]|uniref:hypothetical protein n=1 Tax=Vibrio jasicida TaxID=766224 RepID=UPI0015E46928|nr:hypothetical protein [Vibrio jasicida]